MSIKHLFGNGIGFLPQHPRYQVSRGLDPFTTTTPLFIKTIKDNGSPAKKIVDTGSSRKLYDA